MPNWCSTTYRFRGSREELDLLSKKIVEWTSSSTMKTDFGDPWLGNIVIGAGFKDRIDNADPSQNIRCRGTLTDISDISCDNNGGFSFDLWTETAWVPMAKMWELVIETLKLKTVGFTFVAEESGCEVYWIYDPHNYGDFKDEKVYIDSYGNNKAEEIGGYYTEETAIETLNKFFKTSFNKLDDFYPLCEEYEEENEDSFIGIHEFEIDNVLQD